MKRRTILLSAVLSLFVFSVIGCAVNNAAVKNEETVKGSTGNKGIVGGSGSSKPEGKKKVGVCPIGCSGNTF